MVVGDRFGLIEIKSLFSVKRASKSKARKFKTRGMANCLCDCGVEFSADRSDIRSGHTRSCGCLLSKVTAERNFKHGESESKIYRLWAGIKLRCNCPTATNYKYYGGRGISVCEEWSSDPIAFFEWAKKNGYKDGVEIDRIDNDGNYTPENCRFVDHMINSQKRSNTRCNIDQAAHVKQLLKDGFTVRQAADKAGIPYMSAWHISKGNTWRNA